MALIGTQQERAMRSEILTFVDRLVEFFRPEKVILFGSWAYGSPHPDSDVDLLVILPCEKPFHHTASEIQLAIPHDFAIDLLVRPPQLVAKRLAEGDRFYRQIVEKGQTLYETPS